MSKLSQLKPNAGAVQDKKRKGRGPGTGNGTTGGRGSNGYKSRRGSKTPLGFEGGQMPLSRSLPKRGFYNLFRKEYETVKIGTLDKKAAGLTTMDPEQMAKLNLISNKDQMVKVLGDGELSIPLTIHAHAFSASALEKIEKANGKAEVISSKKGTDKA